MNIQILLVNSDPYFSTLFSNYVAGSQHELSIACFTDREKALEHYQAHRSEIHAVLSDQVFLEQCGAEALRVCLADFTQVDEERAHLQYLNIYQQRRDMVSDLRRILSSLLDLPNVRLHHGLTKVISFFSTQGGSGKSTLAYLTALRAAAEHKTAYLSFAPAPLPELLYPPVQAPVSGEELLYSVRDRQDPAKTVLPALTRNSHNVYTLPTPHSLQDLLELAAEDLEFLLESVLSQAELEYVVLDLGSELTAVSRMAFDHSDLVALVYSDDTVGQGTWERLRGDPNFSRFGFADRYIQVRNKCRQKADATAECIPFPFSQSLGKGTELPTVLNSNVEFFNGCAQLMRTAAGRE